MLSTLTSDSLMTGAVHNLIRITALDAQAA